jgi:hypothetical protein
MFRHGAQNLGRGVGQWNGAANEKHWCSSCVALVAMSTRAPSKRIQP